MKFTKYKTSNTTKLHFFEYLKAVGKISQIHRSKLPVNRCFSVHYPLIMKFSEFSVT